MRRADLMAGLYASWNRSPESVALLDPSEGQTGRWTFGNLSNQVHVTNLALSHEYQLLARGT